MSENFTSELPFSNRRHPNLNAMPNETDPKGGPRGQNAPKPSTGGDKPEKKPTN